MSLLDRLSFHKPQASERINIKRIISEKTNLERLPLKKANLEKRQKPFDEKRGNELFDKINDKEGEKEIKEEVKRKVDEEVTKLREYEKLGFIGE